MPASDLARSLERMTIERFIAALALALVPTSCVERRLVIRTEPLGARVYVDGARRGEAPLEVPFTFYGERRVEARAPGHRPAARAVMLARPWWQYPPLDLVTELLLPWTIEDRHPLELKLEPLGADDEGDSLLDRAQEMARETEAAAGEGR